jgi:hypothetical protein
LGANYPNFLPIILKLKDFQTFSPPQYFCKKSVALPIKTRGNDNKNILVTHLRE